MSTKVSTYSFEDVGVTISHPNVGQTVANGQGIGSLNITMATERTNHEVAADGAVMISKIKGRNGTLALAIQQTSTLNAWLMKWYNYLETAPASQWAKTIIIIRAPQMGETTTCSFVSPQKLPDKPYQAQGQTVTWNLMSADIQQNPI